MENKSSIKMIMIVLGPMVIGFYQVTESSFINNIVGFILVVINVILLAMYYFEIRKNTEAEEMSKHLLELVANDIEIREFLSNGKRIKAIKRCRILTDCDLLTAQKYVDSRI